jgi:hypothetical protein
MTASGKVMFADMKKHITEAEAITATKTDKIKSAGPLCGSHPPRRIVRIFFTTSGRQDACGS